jgi:hypothetical protein
MNLPGNDPKKTVYKSKAELFGQRSRNIEQKLGEQSFDDDFVL